MVPLLALVFLAGCAGKPATQTKAAPNSADSPAKAAESRPSTPTTIPIANDESLLSQEALTRYCEKELARLPGPKDLRQMRSACGKVSQLKGCTSVSGSPIFHYDRPGKDENAKRILAVSLIHGDETASGSVSRAWVSRLEHIDPRNSWRVIPIANPDGFSARTRYNKNGVDINRNFPSADWDEKATLYWQQKTKRDKRRFPGAHGGSEPETQCLVQHLEEFQPDFIISVHTPLGVLDFDGPPVKNPGFKPLPWTSLGNFPGSLGRYMWVDRNVPVLTIELKGGSGLQRLEEFDRLQDVSGTVAIQAAETMEKEKQQQ